MNLAELDKNFKVETNIKKEGLTFIDAEQSPFKIYGLMREGDRFCRLPKAVAEKTNKQVDILYDNTTGGRLRFMTDSPYIAIKAIMQNITRASHFPLTGIAGFDLYVDGGYVKTYVPPFNIEDGFESAIDLPGEGMQEILIHFPSYAGVQKLYIGLKEGSRIEEAPAYRFEKPVVYYGSSITQGGCCSRPGNTYQNIISRELDLDQINLGFSSGALGEDPIIEHIIGLEMQAFVYDYDHNAPNEAHLEATHERMFQKIRAAHPKLPIIIVTAPRAWMNDTWKRRQAIIRKTYENALAAGDQNVYFIPGDTLFPPMVRQMATVDNTHPNDAGFAGMAAVIGAKLKEILMDC